jgi:ABC-type glycerol-3-phosphate transport system substrate-binding protein
MNSLTRALSLLSVAVIGVLFSACGLGIEPTVQLMTNRPEMAAYVDRFNAVHSDVKVEILYVETPSQAVLDGARADLVIGEWLAGPAVMDRLDALGDLVKPGKIDPAWFYPGLLAMASRDNRPVLIPISFTLPAIVYLRSSQDVPNMFMPLDILQSMSAAYRKTGKNGSLTAVGFSPLWDWNADFLTASALLFGARFRPGRGGLPAWEENGLKETVDFLSKWLAEVNTSVAADQDFSRRYLVQPWYKLLASGKILFALTSFRDFFSLPEEERRDLDFRWLSRASAIPVMDNVLFGGVLRSSRNKGGARAFLQWFCSLPVQQSLLTVNQSLRIGVFGITDGFSAYRILNEKDLPQKYPLLLGHIPQENLLVFPETLPDNWVRLRDGVIRPWIVQKGTGQDTEDLEKVLAAWQQGQKK